MWPNGTVAARLSLGIGSAVSGRSTQEIATESSDLRDVVGLGDAVVGLVVSFVVGDGEFPQAAVRSRKARRARRIVNFRIA